MLLGVARAQVEKLPCDYQENPLAMDATAPRLSWRMFSHAITTTSSGGSIMSGACERTAL
jgi:hypothetical protein